MELEQNPHGKAYIKLPKVPQPVPSSNKGIGSKGSPTKMKLDKNASKALYFIKKPMSCVSGQE